MAEIPRRAIRHQLLPREDLVECGEREELESTSAMTGQKGEAGSFLPCVVFAERRWSSRELCLSIARKRWSV
jgi:hypothetical protein